MGPTLPWARGSATTACCRTLSLAGLSVDAAHTLRGIAAQRLPPSSSDALISRNDLDDVGGYGGGLARRWAPPIGKSRPEFPFCQFTRWISIEHRRSGRHLAHSSNGAKLETCDTPRNAVAASSNGNSRTVQ